MNPILLFAGFMTINGQLHYNVLLGEYKNPVECAEMAVKVQTDYYNEKQEFIATYCLHRSHLPQDQQGKQ